jgi:ribonuclease HI
MAAKRAPIVALDDRALNVFTDGSTLSGPRSGGIGIVIITFDADGNEVPDEYLLPGYQLATNQEMELKACIEALRIVTGKHAPVDVSRFTKVIIHTDSMYVVENWNSALYTWPRARWHTRDGKPVINATLWQDMVKMVHRVGRRVELVWHKGHKSGNPHNKSADRLARASANVPLHAPITPREVRRKTSTKSTVAGSIRPEGQCLRIRVVGQRSLRVQNTTLYKCEVKSEDSPYYENVDDLVSDHYLKRGHTYDVRLNDDPKNPRIEHVFREVEPTEPTT